MSNHTDNDSKPAGERFHRTDLPAPWWLDLQKTGFMSEHEVERRRRSAEHLEQDRGELPLWKAKAARDPWYWHMFIDSSPNLYDWLFGKCTCARCASWSNPTPDAPGG
jgi:hypothetical protein